MTVCRADGSRRVGRFVRCLRFRFRFPLRYDIWRLDLIVATTAAVSVVANGRARPTSTSEVRIVRVCASDRAAILTDPRPWPFSFLIRQRTSIARPRRPSSRRVLVYDNRRERLLATSLTLPSRFRFLLKLTNAAFSTSGFQSRRWIITGGDHFRRRSGTAKTVPCAVLPPQTRCWTRVASHSRLAHVERHNGTFTRYGRRQKRIVPAAVSTTPSHAQILPGQAFQLRRVHIPIRFTRREIPQPWTHVAGIPTAPTSAAPTSGERIFRGERKSGEVARSVALDDNISLGSLLSREEGPVVEIHRFNATDMNPRKFDRGRNEYTATGWCVGGLPTSAYHSLPEKRAHDAAATSPGVETCRSRWSPRVLVGTGKMNKHDIICILPVSGNSWLSALVDHVYRGWIWCISLFLCVLGVFLGDLGFWG